MSAAIGPGDWVECIQNCLPSTLPPIGLVVGRIYRVEAVGVTQPDDVRPNEPWVRLVGIRYRVAKKGFPASWFRPVYRPRSDFIQSLKAPAPEVVRELIGAD